MLRVITPLIITKHFNHTFYQCKLPIIVAGPGYAPGSEAYETSEVTNFSNPHVIFYIISIL